MYTITQIKNELKNRPKLSRRLGNIYETTMEYQGSIYDQVIEFDRPGCIKVVEGEIFVDCDGVWLQDAVKDLGSAFDWIESEYRRWNV